MGKELVAKILPVLDKIIWPQSEAMTQFGLQTYEMGMDWVDQYEEDARAIQTAINTFKSSDSRPYALAGISYLLTSLSREKKGQYDADGLAEAMKWLSAAQNIEPDRPQINFIEAQIYVFQNELDNARVVLDYLHEQAPYIYRLNITEALWQEKSGDFDGMEHYYLEAERTANTVPQKVRIQTILGDSFLKIDQYEKALAHYKQAIYFNREEPRLWHKKSLIYWRLNKLEDCKRCNEIVIRLSPKNKSALRLQEELNKKLGGSTGLFGRVRGQG